MVNPDTNKQYHDSDQESSIFFENMSYGLPKYIQNIDKRLCYKSKGALDAQEPKNRLIVFEPIRIVNSQP